MKNNNTKILAVDPGYGRIGFAVLEKNIKGTTLLFSECIETDQSLTFDERLEIVISCLKNHIKKYSPKSVVLEKIFFSKNKKTALQVSEVRGACIYAIKESGAALFEYHPGEIKKAITGNGNATKKDIIKMAPLLVQIEKKDKMLDDEYDAIAIGLAHLATIS